MGDFATNSNIEELASFADDLVAILKDPTDVHNLNQCLEHFKTLQSSCDDDFNSVQSSVEGMLTSFSLIWVFIYNHLEVSNFGSFGGERIHIIYLTSY